MASASRYGDTRLAVPPLDARTPWFLAATPPERVGPYEVVTYSGYVGWAWWTGSRFGECWPQLESALRMRGESGLSGGRTFNWVREWRGLLVRCPHFLDEDWQTVSRAASGE